jgi:hypothetical protein
MSDNKGRYFSPSDQDYERFLRNAKLAVYGKEFEWDFPRDRAVVGKQMNAKECEIKSDVKGLVLIMIVKNESEIIKRCLDSVIGIVNGICITDTNSDHPEDGSDKRYCPDIIKEWANDNNMPCVVPINEFTKETFQFDIARTLSFVNGKRYFPNAKYFITIDADMELKMVGDFNVNKLTLGGYTLIQQTFKNRYSNTRIMAADTVAKVKGCTHEFWTIQRMDSKIGKLVDVKQETLYSLEIKDNDDGKCKDDKFVRDKYLLERGILCKDTTDVLRVRYSFYLAQTYMSLKQYRKSIDFYNIRHYAGYWDEERWYCLLNIGKIMITLHNNERYKLNVMKRSIEKPGSIKETEIHRLKLSDVKIEALMLMKQYQIEDDSRTRAVEAMERAWQYRPIRAEPFYELSKMYREEANNELGFYYAKAAHEIGYPIGDKLFIDINTYDYLIDFGLSICGFYLPNQKNFAVQAHRRLKRMYDQLPANIQSAVDSNDQFYKC